MLHQKALQVALEMRGGGSRARTEEVPKVGAMRRVAQGAFPKYSMATSTSQTPPK
jgi:hypothetical protein